MSRYEVTFVIDTDLEDVATQPWWPMLGEEVMPIEWLEYIAIRDLEPEEFVLDIEFEKDTINIIDMTTKEHVIHRPNLQLVVDNDENTKQESSD